MIKKLISLTIIFSMFSIDLVRAMEPDEEQRHLQRRLSATIVTNDKEEEPQGQKVETLSLEHATHQKSSSGDGADKADEQTPLLDQFRNRFDGEEKDIEAEGEGKDTPSDPSKLQGVNALRSILLADPDGEHLEDGDSESMSPDSHVYLFLGERDVPDLEHARERLEKIESRPSFLKWGYWDNIFNKMTYAVWLRQNDMTSMPAKGCCPGRPLWIDGDGLPLVTGFSAARRLTGFYEGTASFINASMSLILYGLMGYEVYEQVQDIKNFQALKVFEVIWNGDSESIKGILSFFASPEYATYSRYCLAIFALPLLWGLQESFSFARVNLYEAPDTFKKAIQIVREFTFPETRRGFFSSLWKDSLRWMFPHYGIESAVDYLLYSLLLDGNLPIQDRKAAFGVLVDFARNVPGYAKTQGLAALEKIAHGISLKQFDVIEQNYGKVYKEALLTEKAWALDELRKYNPGFRKAGVKGFFPNLYAHYLLWEMGDFGHPVSIATLTLYKVGKLALTINFMIQIGKQIAEYLYCPNPLKQGVNAAMQPTGGYSTYNQQCFNAYLSVFNRIPNQPSCTLVNLMPNFNLNASNFTLFNLSGAVATGEQVAELLMGLRQYQSNVHLTHFDLSNNVINTESGMMALFEALRNFSQSAPPGQGIRMLNLSNNNIGLTDDSSTLVLGINLAYLPELQTLDLSQNWIGLRANNGTQAIGESLKSLTQLEVLDLSQNSIGYVGEEGTQAVGENLRSLANLQTLDLSQNNMGYTADNGTQAMGEGLQHITNLQNLDLSSNYIGWKGDNGTITIGESLRSFPQLRILDLSSNYIGYTADNGTQVIGENLRSLSQLRTLDLSENYIDSEGDVGTQAIGEGLQYLPQLQALDLSNNAIGGAGFFNITEGILRLNNLQSLYVQQLFGISLPSSQLTLLKQFWNHRNNNTDVYALITAQDIQDYLAALPNNTQIISIPRNFPYPSAEFIVLFFNGLRRFQQLQILDLSGNGIGFPGDNGTITIGESLRSFPQLQTLNLSQNGIGNAADNGTQAIGEGLQYLTNLQTLDLSGNVIGVRADTGTQIIGESLKSLLRLKSLDLSLNVIGYQGDEGVQAIGESLKSLLRLKSLDLSDNWIGYTGDNGTQVIGEGLRSLTNLQTLGLSQSYIGYSGDNGTQAIGESLKYLTQLQTVDLSYNQIGSTGDDGIIAIGESLPYLTNLQNMDLYHNAIGGIGAQSFFNALPQLICHAPNLTALNLQYNNFTGIPWSQTASALEGQYSGQIQQACEKNRCFGTPITQNQTAIQCNAMQNLNNQLIPLEQENCPIPIAGASSLSSPFLMSLFMMSQRSGLPLVLLSLWLLTFNLFADYS